MSRDEYDAAVEVLSPEARDSFPTFEALQARAAQMNVAARANWQRYATTARTERQREHGRRMVANFDAQV